MMDYRSYDVVYADAEEKFVKTVMLYGKSGDDYVYAKSTTAEDDKIDKDTLMELLKKGVIVSYEGAFYTPVIFKDETTKVSLTIATAIASESSTSVVLYSKEHSEG